MRVSYRRVIYIVPSGAVSVRITRWVFYVIIPLHLKVNWFFLDQIIFKFIEDKTGV